MTLPLADCALNPDADGLTHVRKSHVSAVTETGEKRSLVTVVSGESFETLLSAVQVLARLDA